MGKRAVGLPIAILFPDHLFLSHNLASGFGRTALKTLGLGRARGLWRVVYHRLRLSCFACGGLPDLAQSAEKSTRLAAAFADVRRLRGGHHCRSVSERKS